MVPNQVIQEKEQKFQAILDEAFAEGKKILDQFIDPLDANAWGDIIFYKNNDFGKWLGRKWKDRKKIIKYSIPHSNYLPMFKYAMAVTQTLHKYEIDCTFKIEYN